jgi:hypothetical protein
MADFLRDRFPLGETSTVYMSGKALYTLVRWRKPGLITPIELYPSDAEEFRAAVREAQAEAWAEGYDTGASGDLHPEENPYL